MKKKLGIAFTLIALSLIGIIVFQGYWTVNAYRVNKKQFDNDIDSAMVRAMDSCKRDYFDSVRLAIIKRISGPDFVIHIDTLSAPDSINTTYDIRVADKLQSMAMMINSPYTVRKPILDFYKRKIKYRGREDIPALLTEMSFYVPSFLNQLMFAFSMADLDKGFASLRPLPRAPEMNNGFHPQTPQLVSGNNIILSSNMPMRDTAFQHKLLKLYKEHNTKTPNDTSFGHKLTQLVLAHKEKLKADTVHLRQTLIKQANAASQAKPLPVTPYERTIAIPRIIKQANQAQYPPNYHQADSIKIYKYFKKELQNININTPFTLNFSNISNRAKTVTARHSETTEFPYQYHGYAYLTPNMTNRVITYTKAIFNSPQYAVMKGMMINLSFSALLIILTGFCFLYVYRTILEQKKLGELKDDFINNMTHELKTPIATITVAIEGLQNFNALNDPEKTRRYLETSREQLNRLNLLVTKVLNIAAFEGKEVELSMTDINVDELVHDVIRTEKMKAVKPVNFNYLNRDAVKTIHADAFHFRNVLLNLIDNAIKYSGDAVDLAISVYHLHGMACIAVKDNGIGIAPADLAQVFDKFYRVPTGNVHNVKGTGLGLSYIKYIVEAHGGTISVNSVPSSGSEFIIALPD